MRKALDAVYLASGWLAAFFIAAIALVVIAQVSLNLIDRISTLIRGTAIGLTIPSYADFTGFFLAAASFLALAHSLRDGAHIRVTILISHLSSKVALALEYWCLAVAAAISCYFTWYTGALVIESYSFNDLSPGMIAVPLWIPQTAMLVGLAILSIALIDQLLSLFWGRQPTYLDTGEGVLVGDESEDSADRTATEKHHG
ncbi:TRAP transporter small permease [Desulfofustis limnaeus]|jgi:TRAP-type C4-dicarboxylate transport system permease small subunit|uniref:Membrane protein n=1 Tax=Desulfofustis limnaeus TaxID=2740163 RepID=A0ABM7WCH2_9BACT|nr:TRAP transporter small permease [Desulfofustis limnaeus]MDX9894508.1 TRAP transporter small permease [Desulfofustis sp.]BDD88591.1 membrane protein [Desulfofustis limnaeus]